MSHSVDDQGVERWMQRYFAAWRSNDADEVADLFTAGAEYVVSPFAAPWLGRSEIVARWTAGDNDLVRERHRVLAVRGSSAVVHWNAVIGLAGGARLEQDGILLLDFEADGRCRSHREWFTDRVLDEQDGAASW